VAGGMAHACYCLPAVSWGRAVSTGPTACRRYHDIDVLMCTLLFVDSLHRGPLALDGSGDHGMSRSGTHPTLMAPGGSSLGGGFNVRPHTPPVPLCITHTSTHTPLTLMDAVLACLCCLVSTVTPLFGDLSYPSRVYVVHGTFGV
jgi:hypothetical protein